MWPAATPASAAAPRAPHGRRPRRRTPRASLLALALLLVACAAGRLSGPGYGSEGDPFLAPGPAAAPEHAGEPVHRLILIGDAGDPAPGEPTLRALGRWGDADPARTTVVFLGDNIYPAGLREEDRAHGEWVLDQQIGATRAPKIFVPGNHDWGSSGGAGQLATLRAQQAYLLAQPPSARVDFLPRDGCPGPAVRELLAPGDALAGGLVLVVVDFHWWLLPEPVRPQCAGIEGTSDFVARLREALAAHADANVVVAAHHPLRSGGPHGGYTRGFWTDLGAALYVRLRGSIQDLWEPGYAAMVEVVSATLAEEPPLAFAAGHDHGLQVLEGGDVARVLVVSGAGSASKITGVAAIEGTLFAHAHPGFVVLDFVADADGAAGPAREGAVLRVVETGRAEPVYELRLELDPGAAVPAADEIVAPGGSARN